MHDHTLNFKADFDILGTANTAQLTSFVPVNQIYVWSDTPRQTMKLQREFVASEDDSRLIWNRATQYRIVNTDCPNKLGEYRGYRILPTDGEQYCVLYQLRCLLTVSIRSRHHTFHEQSIQQSRKLHSSIHFRFSNHKAERY